MKKKWLIGWTVIVGTVAALAYMQLSSNLVYFYTPLEVLAEPQKLHNKTIKLGAMVEKGSIAWDKDTLTLNFISTDLKKARIPVSYRGPAPDLFKEGQGVVSEGVFNADEKKLYAQKLIVKHSEEYKKPDGTSMDHELLQKSLFKETN